MYAVVRIRGQQLRVEPEQTVQVPRMHLDVGTRVEIDEVLAVGEGGRLVAGRPLVDGARVDAEIVAHGRGPQVRVFKFKRRKDYRRTMGHRTDYTELRIHAVHAAAASTAAAAPATAAASEEAEAAE